VRRNLSRPPGLDEPEVCACGHYGYVHGLFCCNCWAHPEHCWQGRLSWTLFGMGFKISLRCPCDKGWVNGELVTYPDLL
jgi:hypothetical protein